ncbi:uncharacterized protein AKAW2_51488S [Aspergillus luchuensis]|uniref:Invertebrate defensins family profile domain-containing protein n=3 Tax=Aspergillus subgen. Circumdati TaxID=2720871 RepID=A0A8G1R0G3_9EURO|nr:hypothetical protein BO85DRAFT_36545 [Aspergillus piperis CBS 112811]XP_041544908.1 uncharacterized protein AKAW2_51488S [Aspergillus luchuensis]OJZ87496.1 hypothetical protein ASPFODRAFT_45168 [Aspergillus luchuensis CBS 106.47]RAH57253.1 hypothetical protein BO85DRAFT_36545 [Aspergillus piperis CBS 112811]BCS01146.1 hypothetical protein AKAW2_51488S [Aspergillus luchuensis]
MRFTIPLTLFFAALAIAAPAAEADNDVDAAVSEDPGLADAQRCRPGYRQCMDNCNRHHGGERCFRACWAHYC